MRVAAVVCPLLASSVAGGAVAPRVIARAPNIVEGSVRTTDGRPVPGATIRISGATGAGRGTTIKATTDRAGAYRVAVPLGHYDVDGFADVTYGGQVYRELWLDRVSAACGRVMSDRGIVRHFVLRVSGPKRCTTNDDTTRPGGYVGGEVAVHTSQFPADAVVTFTLAPVGPLADGTAGRTLRYDRTGAALQRTAGALDAIDILADVPLGRYQVSAEARYADGRRQAVRLVGTDGGSGERVTLTFAANRLYPYGIGRATLGYGGSAGSVAATEPAATRPATTPPPAPAATAGGLPAGRYACSYRSPYAGDIPTEHAIVIEGASYRAYGSAGSYRVDAGGQTVHWTSGPLAGADVRATYARKNGRHAITVVGGGAAGDPGGTHECVLSGG